MPLPEEQNSTEMDSAIQAFKDWRSSREKIFASNDAPINLLEIFRTFLGTGRETE